MATPFKGVINTDIRDSTPDWEPYIPPKAPARGDRTSSSRSTTTPASRPGRRSAGESETADAAAARRQRPDATRSGTPRRCCSPTRSTLPDRPQPPPERHGLRSPRRRPDSRARTGTSRRSAATLAEVHAGQAGWSTFWLGKNHNVPVEDIARRRDRSELAAPPGLRPLLRLPRRRDQPAGIPTLVEDNHFIDQPYQPEEGYHLSKDLADKAIRMIRDVKVSSSVAAVVHVVLPGREPRAAPRPEGVGRQVQGHSSTTATRHTASGCSPRMIEKGIMPEGHAS